MSDTEGRKLRRCLGGKPCSREKDRCHDLGLAVRLACPCPRKGVGEWARREGRRGLHSCSEGVGEAMGGLSGAVAASTSILKWSLAQGGCGLRAQGGSREVGQEAVTPGENGQSGGQRASRLGLRPSLRWSPQGLVKDQTWALTDPRGVRVVLESSKECFLDPLNVKCLREGSWM